MLCAHNFGTYRTPNIWNVIFLNWIISIRKKSFTDICMKPFLNYILYTVYSESLHIDGQDFLGIQQLIFFRYKYFVSSPVPKKIDIFHTHPHIKIHPFIVTLCTYRSSLHNILYLLLLSVQCVLCTYCSTYHMFTKPCPFLLTELSMKMRQDFWDIQYLA